MEEGWGSETFKYEGKNPNNFLVIGNLRASVFSYLHNKFCYPIRAQNRASGGGGQQQGRRQKVTNQVIRKGWLQLGGGGVLKGSKDYWFVLTGKYHY